METPRFAKLLGVYRVLGCLSLALPEVTNTAMVLVSSHLSRFSCNDVHVAGDGVRYPPYDPAAVSLWGLPLTSMSPAQWTVLPEGPRGQSQGAVPHHQSQWRSPLFLSVWHTVHTRFREV